MKQILDHTILRRLDHVAGCVSSDPLPDDPSEMDDAPAQPLADGDLPFSTRRSGARLVYKYMNFDPRGNIIGHYCMGCCRNEAEALANVKAAAVQGGLLGGFASTTPSKGRHGSSTESLGEQNAGVMCFNLLPRALRRAFPTWQSMNVVQQAVQGIEEEDDKRKYMRGKTYRSCKYLESQRDKMSASVLSWTAEPADHLWMKLQYLDARHSALLDIQDDKLNPFLECQRSVSAALAGPLMEGPLQTVFRHWGAEGDDGQWLKRKTFNTQINMISQTHWRFILYFKVSPFPMGTDCGPTTYSSTTSRSCCQILAGTRMLP